MGLSASSSSSEYPIYCDESVMRPKAHGTCEFPAQGNLRWGCDRDTADRICCFNRHYAEHSGYWSSKTSFLKEIKETAGETTFYDTVTGKPLFVAPRGRTVEEFLKESENHGTPCIGVV